MRSRFRFKTTRSFRFTVTVLLSVQKRAAEADTDHNMLMLTSHSTVTVMKKWCPPWSSSFLWLILHILYSSPNIRCLKAGRSLWYRIEVLLEAACHTGQQAEMIVHTAAHTLIHQSAHRRLLRPRVEQVFGFIVAVHSASRETILKDKTVDIKRSDN